MPLVTFEEGGVLDMDYRQALRTTNKQFVVFDGSPVVHMWRSMIWPNNFL